MPTCSKCGATVAEQKAFCQDCGAPMTPQARTPTQQPQPNLGATVIVPPSEWPSMPNAPTPGAPRPAQPTPPPRPAPAATAPQTPSPAAPMPRPTTPTPAPAPSQATGQRGLIYLLVGAIVLLLIIIALVLLR